MREIRESLPLKRIKRESDNAQTLRRGGPTEVGLRLLGAGTDRLGRWLSLSLFAADKGGEIPIEGAIVKALENRYHFQVGGLCPPARIARVFDYVMRNRAAKSALCGPKAADLKSATFQVF